MEHVRVKAGGGDPPRIVRCGEVIAVPFRGEATAIGGGHPRGDALTKGA